ncbi:hypothetical protein GCM10023075_49810 [Streptosporangium album]|uniref:hypothetical protein n=1 Tax=Streptosporangium album TaxID=47479 RepID=UPI0031E6D866
MSRTGDQPPGLAVTGSGTRDEAVACVNDHWSASDGDGPRVWIVGLDLAYHEDPEYWAHTIYHGAGSSWWRLDGPSGPLPPP